MKQMKVFDIIEECRKLGDYKSPEYRALFEVSHAISTEAYGQNNDSFYEWTVGDPEDWGFAQIDLDLLNAHLLANGADDGETVLIKHWW